MTPPPASRAELKRWIDSQFPQGAAFNLWGGRSIEGHGLVRMGGRWVWYYTERGGFEPLQSFDTESEAVRHAMPLIRGLPGA